jgi:hypothetical protein
MDLIQQGCGLQVLKHHFLAVLVAYHVCYCFLRVQEPENLREPEYAVLTIHLRLRLHLKEGHGAQRLVLLVLSPQGLPLHLVCHHCVADT